MRISIILLLVIVGCASEQESCFMAYTPADGYYRDAETGELRPEWEDEGYNVDNCVQPVYPKQLYEAGIEGYVDVKIWFNSTTREPVLEFTGSSGQSEFKNAVMSAMSEWRLDEDSLDVMQMPILHRTTFKLDTSK